MRQRTNSNSAEPRSQAPGTKQPFSIDRGRITQVARHSANKQCTRTRSSRPEHLKSLRRRTHGLARERISKLPFAPRKCISTSPCLSAAPAQPPTRRPQFKRDGSPPTSVVSPTPRDNRTRTTVCGTMTLISTPRSSARCAIEQRPRYVSRASWL
jgi:hypothetical protein